MRASALAATTVLATVLSAAPAHAVTSVSVGFDFGPIVIVTGDGADNAISFSIAPGTLYRDVSITDAPNGTPQPITLSGGGAECQQVSTTVVRCRDYLMLRPYYRLDLGAGADTVDPTATGGTLPPLRIAAGPGDDRIALAEGKPLIDGGDGDDILSVQLAGTLRGGPGRDVLAGGSGADEIDGGGGQDRIFANGGDDSLTSRDDVADEVDCGSGLDAVVADFRDALALCERVDSTPVDADADGSPLPADCADADPSVRPGASEVAGNGKDDDCAGGDAPAPAAPAAPGVRGSVGYGFRIHRAHTRISTLVARSLEPDAVVGLRCRGRGCPFRRREARRVKGDRVVLTRYVRRARFRRGARLEIRITKPGRIGKIVQITFRGRAKPRVSPLCLPEGAERPGRC